MGGVCQLQMQSKWTLPDIPASSPAGVLPAAPEGDEDELDIATAASSLRPASLEAVMFGIAQRSGRRANLCGETSRGRRATLSARVVEAATADWVGK